MGKYITISDVKNTAAVKTYLALGGDTNFVDAIAYAEEHVESELQKAGETLPLSSAKKKSKKLKFLCLKVALWNLWIEAQGEMPENVRLGYEEASKMLNQPNPLGIETRLEKLSSQPRTTEVNRG